MNPRRSEVDSDIHRGAIEGPPDGYGNVNEMLSTRTGGPTTKWPSLKTCSAPTRIRRRGRLSFAP